MIFYIFHKQGVCLVDHVHLICSMYSWWEGFGSSSLATQFLGFNCAFISTTTCESSPGVAPESALEDLSLPLWEPGVEMVQLLGLQGFWQHQVPRGVGSYGSKKYSALEGYGNHYWPICHVVAGAFLPGEPFSLTEKPGRPVYRVTKSWTWLKWPCAHRHKTFFFFFLPMAALPQWELSMKVMHLLGLQGPWLHQVCRDMDCLLCRSYGLIRVFFQTSCHWRSEGLFGQSFSIALPIL